MKRLEKLRAREDFIIVYKQLNVLKGSDGTDHYYSPIRQDTFWKIGETINSSRSDVSLSDYEKIYHTVTVGFHFYLYRSPAKPRIWATGWGYTYKIKPMRVMGVFRVSPSEVVAVGKYDSHWSCVARKATLLEVVKP